MFVQQQNGGRDDDRSPRRPPSPFPRYVYPATDRQHSARLHEHDGDVLAPVPVRRPHHVLAALLLSPVVVHVV